VSYTLLAVVAVLAAALLDVVVLRTKLLLQKGFWAAYGIVVFFQLVTNGLLTGIPIVTYNRARILGLRIVYAPVEDLLFGFAMVTVTLAVWVWAGRLWPSRHDEPATRVGRR
jgi:lycopene cyclase domain-containing protein